MVDVLTPEQRRRNMSNIRGADTKPELLVRRSLHARGFRYRLNAGDLPGRPDIVLPRYHTVVFVHGCFWHDHRCALCKEPATRPAFWKAKIARNAQRDQRALHALQEDGWKVAIVWECALRGPQRQPMDTVADRLATYLAAGRKPSIEISATS